MKECLPWAGKIHVQFKRSLFLFWTCMRQGESTWSCEGDGRVKIQLHNLRFTSKFWRIVFSRSVDKAVLEDGVTMQVEEQLNWPFLLALGNQFFKTEYFRVKLSSTWVKSTVKIIANDAGSIVADEHSIGIEHGHNFKHNIFSKQPFLQLSALRHFHEQAIEHPRRWGFSRVCPRVYYYEPFLALWV